MSLDGDVPTHVLVLDHGIDGMQYRLKQEMIGLVGKVKARLGK